MLNGLRVFGMGFSWGGFESLAIPFDCDAYRTATKRWPEQAVGWFALANSRYAGGDLRGAEAAFRESVNRQADFAPGWFNLSQVLDERGCKTEAASARQCAQRLKPDDKRFTVIGKQGTASEQCAAPMACPVQ